MPNSTSEADDADAQLQHGVDAQRMVPAGDDARQQQAAQAHAAHERAQQHAQRDGEEPITSCSSCEPDDLVDQRRAAAADEEQEQQRQEPPGASSVGRFEGD